MKTRAALKAIANLDSASPLAAIRDTIVERVASNEAARMSAARDRARMTGGAGPLLSVLQKRLAEYRAAQLVNNAAPAVTCADFHTVLRTASEKAEGRDAGLKRASTHAYRLWTKDPTGSLSVGDVARVRSHYIAEYPRSKVASVIDVEVPKVGYNTLPVTQLTRVAASISRAGGSQEAYDEAITRAGLDTQTHHAFRCRAFVRSLLDGVAPEAEPVNTGTAERVALRLATDEDPILGRFAQFIEDEPMPSDDMKPQAEEAAIDSPITGEPMMLELQVEDMNAPDEPDDMGYSGPLPGGMEVMGQLEDFASEQVVVMQDPTDPEGGELEVSIRPLDDAGPMPSIIEEEPMPADMPEDEHEHVAAGCAEDHEHSAACASRTARRFEVYASIDGRLAREPVDSFVVAGGMSAALARIAGHGVEGHIHADPASLADEAFIALANGNFLQVVAAEELQGKDEAFTPDVNDQQPDAMPAVDTDIMIGDETMGASAQPFETLANAVLEGRIAKRAGWALSVNGDAEVELHYQGKLKKKASLGWFDTLVSDFVVSSAPEAPTPLKYAALRNTETGAYTVVTDVPQGDDNAALKYNARRILAAIQRVLPGAQGILRKDAKLQMEFEADDAALGRVRRILEDQYRAREFVISAQQMEPMPGSAAAEGQVQLTPTDPNALTQNPPVPAGTVAPPMQQQQPAGQPQGYVGPPPRAAFVVTYKGPDGSLADAPVDARTASVARDLFMKFNGDCEIVKVAQLELPGEPIGGGEEVPMPIEEQLMPEADPMALGADPMMSGGGGLSQEETDALRAALTHYRNQGVGPASALDQLMSQYRDMFERFGDKTDLERHEMEAEAMKLAAEVWTQPAIMEHQAQFDPSVNNQQPDAVSVDKDLGPDSETDDTVSNALEVSTINTQAPVSGTPSKDTALGKDSETNDPGSFGAPKPKAHPDQQPQKGESFADTDLGRDSETDPKLMKKLDTGAAK